MWNLYLKSNEGIAIQSTFKRLIKCFENHPDKIHVRKVEYIDYQNQKDKIWKGSSHNILVPFFKKRKSFEHEREIRAIISKWPVSNGEEQDILGSTNYVGIQVPIIIESLIKNIYVAPTAPEWFLILVKSIIVRYSLTIEVMKSSLEDDPVF